MICSFILLMELADLKSLKPGIDQLIMLVNQALEAGRIDILDWIMSEGGLRATHLTWKWILYSAIRGEHISSLEWVMTKGVTPEMVRSYFSNIDMTFTVDEHNICPQLPNMLETYQWILNVTGSITNGIASTWIIHNVERNNLPVLQWLYKRGPQWFGPERLESHVICRLLKQTRPDIIEWLLSVHVITVKQVMHELRFNAVCSSSVKLMDWGIKRGLITQEMYYNILLCAVHSTNLDIVKWMEQCGYIYRDDVLKLIPMVLKMVGGYRIHDEERLFEIFLILTGSAGIGYRHHYASSIVKDDDPWPSGTLRRPCPGASNALGYLKHMQRHMGMTIDHCVKEDLLYTAIQNNRHQIAIWLLENGYPSLDLKMVTLTVSPSEDIIKLLCNNGADRNFFSESRHRKNGRVAKSYFKRERHGIWHKIESNFLKGRSVGFKSYLINQSNVSI
jgi:hypothetical protein